MSYRIKLRQSLKCAETTVQRYINKVYFKSQLQNVIKSKMEETLNFTFILCQPHHTVLKTAILSEIIQICLKKFCTAVNRCLNGKCKSKVKTPILKYTQAKYQSKLKHK